MRNRGFVTSSARFMAGLTDPVSCSSIPVTAWIWGAAALSPSSVLFSKSSPHQMAPSFNPDICPFNQEGMKAVRWLHLHRLCPWAAGGGELRKGRRTTVRMLHGLHLGENWLLRAILWVCGDVQGTRGDKVARGWGCGGEQCVQSLGKLCQWLCSRGIFLCAALSGMVILGVEACGEPQT